jgi:hypothetical protein
MTILVNVFDFIMLSKKNTITVNGEKILDLTDNNIIENVELDFDRPPFIITKEYEGKAYNISRLYYDTEKYTDILCFINNIGNPFMVSEGMVFQIPSKISIDAMFKKAKKEEEKLTDNPKASTLDKSRAKNKKVTSSAKKSPKTNESVDEQTKVVGGVIEFGTGVSESDSCSRIESSVQKISAKIRADVIA